MSGSPSPMRMLPSPQMWFLLACMNEPPAAPAAPDVPASPVAEAPAPPPATPIEARTPGEPISSTVGVPACDAYLDRYRTCVDAMPQPERLRAAIDQMRDTWILAARAEGGRARIAAACAELTFPPGCS